MDRKEAIEIPFGAFDSELKGWEYTIPEGMKARIEGNKIILEPKESEDERIRKRLIEWVEEFRKLNPTNADHNAECSEAIAWLEKQGSQNLANSEKTCKVEPQFKVGDWVVYNSDICQIVKREEGCNKLVTNFGIEKELVNERNLSTARPWTIQDAKDGDVLCTYECGEPKIVFIIKGTSKKHYALSYHCYYNIMYPHFESDSEKGCLAPNDEDVKPATKEQRDLLFQKIKEAGYEWDSEKKELRKIKQNPAWSEEDENMLACCEIAIDFFKNLGKNSSGHPHPNYFDLDKKIYPERVIDWLKSLKERVQPQNK